MGVKKLLLEVDVGITNVKTSIIDKNVNIHSFFSKKFHFISHKPHWVEQDSRK
jgi:glycerol kinase